MKNKCDKLDNSLEILKDDLKDKELDNDEVTYINNKLDELKKLFNSYLTEEGDKI